MCCNYLCVWEIQGKLNVYPVKQYERNTLHHRITSLDAMQISEGNVELKTKEPLEIFTVSCGMWRGTTKVEIPLTLVVMYCKVSECIGKSYPATPILTYLTCSTVI
jgi:hypothetical protein